MPSQTAQKLISSLGTSVCQTSGISALSCIPECTLDCAHQIAVLSFWLLNITSLNMYNMQKLAGKADSSPGRHYYAQSRFVMLHSACLLCGDCSCSGTCKILSCSAYTNISLDLHVKQHHEAAWSQSLDPLCRKPVIAQDNSIRAFWQSGVASGGVSGPGTWARVLGSSRP